MITANVIALARTQLHVVEATGRNDHPMIVAYLNKLALPPAPGTPGLDHNMSYCAAFVLWCWWRAGAELRGNFWKQRAVVRLLSDAQVFGAVLAKDERPTPGDLATWRYHASAGSTGHVSMITEVTPPGDLVTIGGNEFLDKSKKRQGVHEHALSAGEWSSIAAIVRPTRMLREAP